jgi:hypothetical protein
MTFKTILNSITRCYADGISDKLPSVSDFPSNITDSNGKIDFSRLQNFGESQSNEFIRSIINRIIATNQLQTARSLDIELDVRAIWSLVAESITILPRESTISSIGSQGFLSILLFKFDETKSQFDFIRLHIWDNSLNKYLDKEKNETFSIHTHSFHAQSWVLIGKVVNDRYKVVETGGSANSSLFTVEYNKTLNEINQHTSVAKNSGIDVDVNQTSHEIHMPGSTYEVKSGNYHKSGSLGKDGLSATFFSFTAKDGIVTKSYVAGPKNVQESEINRKMHIDPNYLIEKINSQF